MAVQKDTNEWMTDKDKLANFTNVLQSVNQSITTIYIFKECNVPAQESSFVVQRDPDQGPTNPCANRNLHQT